MSELRRCEETPVHAESAEARRREGHIFSLSSACSRRPAKIKELLFSSPRLRVEPVSGSSVLSVIDFFTASESREPRTLLTDYGTRITSHPAGPHVSVMTASF